jgi:hypothetical protein
MKINRNSLISDLNKVMPGISTGVSVIEGADTVVFDNGHVYSYNAAISVDVTETTPSGLKGIVKGIDFYNCLNKLISDEIEVEANEKEWIIKDGKIKVSMTLIESGNTFERFKSLTPNESWVEIDGEDFNKALTICNMPKNNSKFAGVYVDKNTFISTDTYLINKYVAKNEYPSFFISNEAVAQLIKWNDFKAVEMNKNWIQFKSANGTIFSVRSLAPEAFPYDRISNAISGYLQLGVLLKSSFTPDFYNAVERASTFSKEDEGHEVIDMNINSTGCKIKSERVSGAYEEEIGDIKSDGAEFNLELDINMIRSCKSHFDVFKLVERETEDGIVRTVILSKDSSIKIFSTIS